MPENRKRRQIERESFKTWEERASPCVILEITSKGTAEEDRENKYALYQRLGVREYFLFDPLREYLPRPLLGYRLIGGAYEPLPPADDGSLVSAELMLRLCPEDKSLGLYHFATGERLPLPPETHRLWQEARQQVVQERARAEQEQQRAQQARLRAQQEYDRAEQERLRAEQEQQRAEQARLRAQQEHDRAEQERLRAQQEYDRAEQQRLRAEQAEQERQRERQRAEEAERRAAQLAAELAQLRALPPPDDRSPPG